VIFVDANYFLRLLAAPATPQDLHMRDQAETLFRFAARDEAKLTTSEAIIAEVAFHLTSPKAYGLEAPAAAELIRAVLDLRGMRAASKAQWLHALEIWERQPRLGFVDALSLAYCLDDHLELASVDQVLTRQPGVIAYSPE
jgi:predicted nucleic acid-binding protein